MSNRQLLLKLEEWIKEINPNNIKLVWIDFSKDSVPDDGLYSIPGLGQSFILKHICNKNNIPYEIYSANWFENDKDRLLELSKLICWKANNYNTILISKTLKEQLYFREYKKYHFDMLDLLPFGSINQSQIDSLVHYIETEEDLKKVNSYSKLEWLYHEDINYKILSSDKDPTKHFKWGTYSLEQKALIAKMYALIKNRNHKMPNNNVFKYE